MEPDGSSENKKARSSGLFRRSEDFEEVSGSLNGAQERTRTSTVLPPLDLNLVRLPIPPPGHVFKLDRHFSVMMQRVNPYMQTNYRFINRPVVPCSRAKL